MKRRTFVQGAVGIGVAATLTLGLMFGKDLYKKHGAIRFGHLRSEKELRELERLALKSQENKEIIEATGDSTKLHGSWEYEGSFQRAIGAHFSYEKYLSKLKRNFPYDKHLIVADVGGSVGTAAEELQRMKGVEAFVIDPYTALPPKGKGLPRERFFLSKIEETGLPDEIFHFMTSYNSHQFMDAPESFTEPHRLLKKGGAAIFQVQQAPDLDFLEKLNSLEFKEDIHVAWGARMGEARIIPIPIFIKGIKTVYEKMGDRAKGSLGALLIDNAFLISKRNK